MPHAITTTPPHDDSSPTELPPRKNHSKITFNKMSDLNVPYKLKQATEGMAEGDPKKIEGLHAPPGEKGTPEAQAQHAHATTDPPVKQPGGTTVTAATPRRTEGFAKRSGGFEFFFLLSFAARRPSALKTVAPDSSTRTRAD